MPSPANVVRVIPHSSLACSLPPAGIHVCMSATPSPLGHDQVQLLIHSTHLGERVRVPEEKGGLEDAIAAGFRSNPIAALMGAAAVAGQPAVGGVPHGLVGSRVCPGEVEVQHCKSIGQCRLVRRSDCRQHAKVAAAQASAKTSARRFAAQPRLHGPPARLLSSGNSHHPLHGE